MLAYTEAAEKLSDFESLLHRLSAEVEDMESLLPDCLLAEQPMERIELTAKHDLLRVSFLAHTIPSPYLYP